MRDLSASTRQMVNIYKNPLSSHNVAGSSINMIVHDDIDLDPP